MIQSEDGLQLAQHHALLLLYWVPDPEDVQYGQSEYYMACAPDQCKIPKEYGKYDKNTLIPRFTTPEQIHIVVSGGPGKQSQIWLPFVTDMKPVSVVVEE